MAYIDVRSIDGLDIRVRIGGLDPAYNKGTRSALFRLYEGTSSRVDSQSITVYNGVTNSATITLRGNKYNTNHSISVVISNITDYPDVTLTEYDVYTGSVPQPPPGRPSFISSSNVKSTSFDLSWGSVSEASYYVIDINGATQVSYSTSLSMTGASPNTTYTACVKAVNSNGESSERCTTFTTAAPLAAPTISIAAKDSTSVTLNLYSSGADGYLVEYMLSTGGSSWVSLSKRTSPVKVTGLTTYSSYRFRARATSGSEISSYSNVITEFIGYGRPENWEWKRTMTSGGTFHSQSPDGKTAYIMEADDWNNFTQRIYDFSLYKMTPQPTFTAVSSGETVKASTINQAIKYINVMLPTGKLDRIDVGNKVSAKIFNDMRDKLNSIG